MGRVITIVACPRGWKDGEEEKTEKGGIPVIKDIMKCLMGLNLKEPDYVLRRACCVKKIAEHIDADFNEHRDRPELIQIIGHGEPGVVALASAWLDDANQLHNGDMLDSDPHAYAPLKGKVVHPTKVWLLGCGVGSGASKTMVANGPTLVFDLCQLWSPPDHKPVHVSAPVVGVSSTDFCANGQYQFPERMITASGRSVSADPSKNAISDPQIRDKPWMGTGATRG